MSPRGSSPEGNMMAKSIKSISENRGIPMNAQGNPNAVDRSRTAINAHGVPVLDSVPYAVGACTATRKDGKQCVNRLRSQSEKSSRMCFGHQTSKRRAKHDS